MVSKRLETSLTGEEEEGEEETLLLTCLLLRAISFCSLFCKGKDFVKVE